MSGSSNQPPPNDWSWYYRSGHYNDDEEEEEEEDQHLPESSRDDPHGIPMSLPLPTDPQDEPIGDIDWETHRRLLMLPPDEFPVAESHDGDTRRQWMKKSTPKREEYRAEKKKNDELQTDVYHLRREIGLVAPLPGQMGSDALAQFVVPPKTKKARIRYPSKEEKETEEKNKQALEDYIKRREQEGPRPFTQAKLPPPRLNRKRYRRRRRKRQIRRLYKNTKSVERREDSP